MASTSVISRHLNQSEHLLVILFWYVWSVHLQVKVLLWHLYFLVGSKHIALGHWVKFDARRLHGRGSCLGLLGFRWLLDDLLVLRKTSYLVHAEFCMLFCFSLALGLLLGTLLTLLARLELSVLFAQQKFDQRLGFVFLGTHGERR